MASERKRQEAAILREVTLVAMGCSKMPSGWLEQVLAYAESALETCDEAESILKQCEEIRRARRLAWKPPLIPDVWKAN